MMNSGPEYSEEELAAEKREDLRDRMAIAAMNAFICAFMEETDCSISAFIEGYWGDGMPSKEHCSDRADSIAKASYRIADAMLEARQRTQEDQSESPQP